MPDGTFGLWKVTEHGDSDGVEDEHYVVARDFDAAIRVWRSGFAGVCEHWDEMQPKAVIQLAHEELGELTIEMVEEGANEEGESK